MLRVGHNKGKLGRVHGSTTVYHLRERGRIQIFWTVTSGGSTVQTTVLILVLSEISGWLMFHRVHPVDLSLTVTDDPQYPGYKTLTDARAARPQ
jgi:hypothetical protein